MCEVRKTKVHQPSVELTSNLFSLGSHACVTRSGRVGLTFFFFITCFSLGDSSNKHK